MEKICSWSMNSGELIKSFPAKFVSQNKQILFTLSETKAPHKSKVEYSKVKEMSLPKLFCQPKNCGKQFSVNHEVNVYQYKDYFPKKKTCREWYLNFGDKHLFGYYSSQLLAQDEIMVAEMPVLASIREYLLIAQQENSKFSPTTVDKYNNPTPVLIKNVERRIALNVSKIYGNKFAYASFGDIQKAITKLQSPFLTNVLVMEAPKNRRGNYTKSDILFVMRTAFTGFRALKLESGKDFCVLHTGNWGTGAFGGNKRLMALLQIGCAYLAGIDCVYYHTFIDQYTADYIWGKKKFFELATKKKDYTTEEFVEDVLKLKFKWGFSDGN